MILLILGAGSRLLFIYDVTSKPELNCLAPPHDDYNFVLFAKEMNKDQPIEMHLPIYPAYAHFLRWIFLIFENNISYIKFVQCILGLISTVALFLAGQIIFGSIAGLLAAILYLFYRMNYFFDTSLMSTALSQFLLILGFYGFIRNLKFPSLWSYGLFWIATVYLCLLRVHFWAFLVLGVIHLWVKNKQWQDFKYQLLLVVFSSISLLAFNIAHSPESYRGKFGVLFFIGNNPNATGLLDDIKGVPRTAEGHAKDSILRAHELSNGQGDIKNYWTRRVADDWMKYPEFILPLLWKKIKLLTHNYEILDTESVYYYERNTLLKNLPRIEFWIIFALSLLGMAFSTRLNMSVRPLIFVIVLLTGVLLIFHISSRYRMPLMPFLALCAGFGLSEIFECVQLKKWMRFIVSIMGIAGVWFWSHQDMPLLSLEKDLAYMEDLIRNNQTYANQREETINLYHKWDTLPYQKAIPVILQLANLQCYHEFFTLFDKAYEKAKRDPKTRLKLLTHKAILLEKLFRIEEASAIWEELELLDPTSDFVKKKIQALIIYKQYLS